MAIGIIRELVEDAS